MATKKAISKKTDTKPKNYQRGKYGKKKSVKVSTEDAWKMARRVAEFAYIFQKLDQDGKENQNITTALSKIKPVLQEAYKNWQLDTSRVWKFQSTAELEEIFVGVHDNSIFKEKTEEEVERRVWQLINYGDISPQELFDNNPITIISIREFIEEISKGPRSAARHFFDQKGGHGSESQIRKYRDDYKSGVLPDPMIQYGTPFFERKQLIAAVCGGLLNLSTEELQWLNEEIAEMLMAEKK